MASIESILIDKVFKFKKQNIFVYTGMNSTRQYIYMNGFWVKHCLKIIFSVKEYKLYYDQAI